MLLALEHLLVKASDTDGPESANLNRVDNIHQALSDKNIHVPVVSIDADTFYTSDILSEWTGDNCVASFLDFESSQIFGYVKMKGDPEILS